MLPTISPFPTVFSKGLFLRVVKRCHCVGMGETWTSSQLTKGQPTQSEMVTTNRLGQSYAFFFGFKFFTEKQTMQSSQALTFARSVHVSLCKC